MSDTLTIKTSGVAVLGEEQAKYFAPPSAGIEEAAAADRAVVLDHGHVVMDAPPRAVFSHADELRALGLEVPLAVELRDRLRAAGVALPADLLTEAELVAALGRAAERGGEAVGHRS